MEIVVVTCQLGFVCAYLLIIGANLNSIWPSLSVTEYVLIIAAPEILLSWLPSLKYFGPVSTIVMIVWMFGATVIMVYGFQHLEIREYKFIEISTFPLFFGSVVYAFEGINLIIPMEASMQDPSKFRFIMNVAVVIVTVIFVAFSSLGYMFFYDKTNSVITLNLPDDWVLSKIVKLSFCIVLFLTFPLGMVPIIQVIEFRILPLIKCGKHVINSKIVRTLLVLSTVALTLGIPNFGVLMEFFGSFSNALATFILPSGFYLIIFRGRLSLLKVIINWLIVGLGFVAMGIGTYFSTQQIIDLWKHK